MKLLALVITAGLWFGVTVMSRGKQASDRFTVPLNFRAADNAAVTNAPVQNVEIRVRGIDENIEKIQRSGLEVFVDLTEIAPGENVLTLTPETVSVQLPEGVKVVDVQPSRIAVTIEAIQEKDIVVRAVTEGVPASGFEVYGEPSVIPKTVKVRGPASLVNAVDQLLTDKIILDGRREDFSARQVTVSAANDKVTITNSVVDVLVRIGEKRIERPISVTATNGKTVTATLFGPKTAISKLKISEIKLEIIKDANGDDTPQFDLPPEIEVRNPKIK